MPSSLSRAHLAIFVVSMHSLLFFMLDMSDHPSYMQSVRSSQHFGFSKDNFINWVDDMDISDGEHSDELESMSDGSDSDWVQSNMKAKKHQRRVSSSSNPKLDCQNTQDNAEPEKPPDEKCIRPKNIPSDGCSCSKSSSCKTNKCECRGSGAQCGAGCGCKDSKCSNRDSSTKEKANQGAMLLQNAFSEKEAQDAKPRKPLANIGNNAVSTVLYVLVLWLTTASIIPSAQL